MLKYFARKEDCDTQYFPLEETMREHQNVWVKSSNHKNQKEMEHRATVLQQNPQKPSKNEGCGTGKAGCYED